MSGHSKWATIKRKKAKTDDARGKIFTKISKEIMVAVKQGGSDPEGNFRLKLCIQKAKASNMPADNISRCIQKAAGSGDSQAIDEFFYEGYGPAGIAVLCAIMTDNRNRTASEIRFLFSRNHGNLGETGCVSYLFERKGQLTIALEPDKGRDEEELFLIALESGAEDVSTEEDEGEVITAPEDLEGVRAALLEAGFEVANAEITMLPKSRIVIDDLETAQKLLKLLEALEDNDDVQAVHANYEITPEIISMLEEG